MRSKESSVSAFNVALLTPVEAAKFLNISKSWLDKARMRGDGPAYIRIGRSVRYAKGTLIQWINSQQRLATSQA